ncbi:hypothetical protein [Streptomyces nigrescens]|uniref:hypothetical protein n=1 Tax=Streptomyces nigrescens TaxID=1920 RepID=UPI0036FB2D53
MIPDDAYVDDHTAGEIRPASGVDHDGRRAGRGTGTRLVDALLDRLGLYGPTPEPVTDLCSAMFFDASREDGGWVQCGKAPGHTQWGDVMHEDQWSGVCWNDDHLQAVAADEEEG